MPEVHLQNRSDNSLSKTTSNKHFNKATKREKKILMYKKLISEGCSKKVALDTIVTSKATYYRWNRTYKELGIEGLIPKSRKPHTYRKPEWSTALKNLITDLRKKHSTWGKARLTILLKKDFNITVSESTIGRILTKLVSLEIVKPCPKPYK